MSTPSKDKPSSGQPSTVVRNKDVLRQIPNAAKAKKIGKLLNELDKGKNGTSDVLKMLDMVVSLRRQRFWLMVFLVMLLWFAFLTVASVVGIGYAVAGAVKEAVKETEATLIDGDTVVGANSAYPAVDGAAGGRKERLYAGDKVEDVTIPPGGSPHFRAAGSTQPQAVPRTNSLKNTPTYFFSRLMSFDALMDMKYLFLSACVPDGADEEPACLRLKLTVRPKAVP